MRDHFYIHVKKKFIPIRFQDVHYIMTVNHHVKLVTRHGVYIPFLSLPALEEVLPPADFCRVNKSTVIAIRRIKHYDRTGVYLEGEGDPFFNFGEYGRKRLESQLILVVRGEVRLPGALDINSDFPDGLTLS
jgi:hypothetical protein